MPWAEEDVAKLGSLAEQGFSAAQAAAQFDGRMTRNMAVGIAFRRGIRFHGTAGVRSLPNRTVNRKPKDEPEPEVTAEPRAGMLTIFELEPSSCRWPLGDPRHPDFRFCGQARSGEKPYCIVHCRISYETTEQRRARLQPV